MSFRRKLSCTLSSRKWEYYSSVHLTTCRDLLSPKDMNWAYLAQVGWTSVLPELTCKFRDYINHSFSVISSLVNYYTYKYYFGVNDCMKNCILCYNRRGLFSLKTKWHRVTFWNSSIFLFHVEVSVGGDSSLLPIGLAGVTVLLTHVFGRCVVRISSGTSTFLTKGFPGFP